MLKVGPYVIVEAVMKLTLIVMLAGCGSAGGDAVDLATDDFHRLGELQPDLAGDDADVDMAIVSPDLAESVDLARGGDLAVVQVDLLPGRDFAVSCGGESAFCNAAVTPNGCCGGYNCEAQTGGDRCCVPAGNICTSTTNCCAGSGQYGYCKTGVCTVMP